MSDRDRRLGMNRDITRRDFLNGVAVAVGAAILPGCGKSGEPEVGDTRQYYPPAATGMRGSHPGSFETAHAAVQGQKWTADAADEHYDLVVVGAGISGLSAAYMYRRDVDPDARILIIDNHDDFGGHAKRNEFTLDGRTYIAYGGTMFMDAPDHYPEAARQVIDEIGIELSAQNQSDYDAFYADYGGEYAVFYDEPTYGSNYLAAGGYFSAAGMQDAPVDEAVKAEILKLFADEDDFLADLTPAERDQIIDSHSWREFLSKYGGYSDATLAVLQKWSNGLWGIGIDALPARGAYVVRYPGFNREPAPERDNADPTVHRFSFPDGNASVARLLVRKLIPGAAAGSTMADSITARFDYDALDRAENSTRIRLSSTAVQVQHEDGDLQGDVAVTYVKDGSAQQVTAGRLIWAGYHAMLPHICPDIPSLQREALSSCVRSPLVYTNVLVRNWRSFADQNLRRAFCPGEFFHSVKFSHPVDMGDYRVARSPDQPMVLALQHVPLVPGLPAVEQFRGGRQALLETSFETFERNIREQLDRMLGSAGFDAASDIAGITVNRWAHGYAYSMDKTSGDVAWMPSLWPHERRPWVDARQRIGNIAFAGTDSSSNAMTESAIAEAHRAVSDLR